MYLISHRNIDNVELNFNWGQFYVKLSYLASKSYKKQKIEKIPSKEPCQWLLMFLYVDVGGKMLYRVTF